MQRFATQSLAFTLQRATPIVRRVRLDSLAVGDTFATAPYPESGKPGWKGRVDHVSMFSVTVTVLDRGGSTFAHHERTNVSGRTIVTTTSTGAR